MNDIELLSPAGSFESLNAAIKAGANAVYFGVEQLNMRARAAKPFTIADLSLISEICKKAHVKSYIALNTIVYDHEIPLLNEICVEAKKADISAVIATDMAAIECAKRNNLNIHISTQANISNLEAVKFYAQFSDVAVLARELSLDQIAFICSEIKKQNICGPSGSLVKVEIFIHGALCVSISGKCYMSLALTNHSANRGECLQSCRRSYRIIDETTNDELTIDNKFVMSPKDLCTIGILDKIIQAGVSVLKIEGRGRPVEYVFRVTNVYRQAINAIYDGSYSNEHIEKWTNELESVFNRGFWQNGYYLGHKLGEWSASYGSRAKKQKFYLGYVKNYFSKTQIAQFILESGEVNIGDTIVVTGRTTGYAETVVSSIYLDEQSVQKAVKGQDITIPFPDKIRKQDKLYLLKNREIWQS